VAWRKLLANVSFCQGLISFNPSFFQGHHLKQEAPLTKLRGRAHALPTYFDLSLIAAWMACCGDAMGALEILLSGMEGTVGLQH
jgi:hypothetical protein